MLTYPAVYKPSPFKALGSRPTSHPLPFPLKPFKAAALSGLHGISPKNVYDCIYIPVPPHGSLPTP